MKRFTKISCIATGVSAGLYGIYKLTLS